MLCLLSHIKPIFSEWKNTLRANKKLTEQYSRIKKESAGFKSRLLEYQENFTEYMVRNGELR